MLVLDDLVEDAVLVDDADLVVEVALETLELAPDASPSVAPVAAIRASTSDCVVHVTEVPALLTSGRAAQLWLYAR